MISKNYGIIKRKKAELDALEAMIEEAKREITPIKTAVKALTQRSVEFSELVARRKETEEKTQANIDLLEQAVQTARVLKENSQSVMSKTEDAGENINDVATAMTKVLEQLKIAAKMVEALGDTTAIEIARNPLISTEFEALVEEAQTDAKNAMAAALTALKACFAAGLSGTETVKTVKLEERISSRLHLVLTETGSLTDLLSVEHTEALNAYKLAFDANKRVIKQLNFGQARLDAAQARLTSLEAAYAAANAAALAS